MKPLDLATARCLIDLSGGKMEMKPLGELQLRGAVALQNMLVDPDVGMGYLADEVGMGKTYIVLGVVALMRYFNPGFRVLYLCPSRNVQEKWFDRERPAFTKTNVLTRNFKIRTPQGDPGTPAISCANVNELIYAATTGYYGDVFVRMSSFSMGMGEEEEKLERRYRELEQNVPAGLLPEKRFDKEGIKQAYAKALNYLLPTFDLIVIDEAHNLKHEFESSARNLALSRILGFRRKEGKIYQPRVKHALLLSATPFDLNPRHLYNQLNLVGKGYLMPPEDEWWERDKLRQAMSRFMVRRLNTLNIQGEELTRNMYRREWRKGERAEISFATDEHKLITALVQKKVGDMLDRQSGSPAFQLGLLASFESYAQTSRSGPVKFDGEPPPDGKHDAKDRHLIGIIRDSYVENGFGQSLPHPKMDKVSQTLARQAFGHARKQLVFVRRVKSVSELKQKLDDEYDAWLQKHIHKTLKGNSEAVEYLEEVIKIYRSVRKRRDEDVAGGDVMNGGEGEPVHVPPKNDTLFSWFFRGDRAPELEQKLSSQHRAWVAPDALRKSLQAKGNVNVLLFEFNWADWAANDCFGQSIEKLLQELGDAVIQQELADIPAIASDDEISAFLSVQSAFLRLLARHKHLSALERVAEYLQPLVRSGNEKLKWGPETQRYLSVNTFYGALDEKGLRSDIFKSLEKLSSKIRHGDYDNPDERLEDLIHRVEIHRQLIAQAFRTGHPFIDLYLVRLVLGKGDLDENRRQGLMSWLCDMLSSQICGSTKGLSTAIELKRLNDNLDLFIKNNLPGAHKLSQAELRVRLNEQLPSYPPVVGASGETGNRSVQARKFRTPGYPLVLISTDVFQEGEDLHTFCDSVVHYGLSSSPISIEQKIGRVDRVGAFAHRRLTTGNAERLTDDDYIQVSFPFVKQSIESIQVRVLCKNLNVYLSSLHEIGGGDKTIDEFIDASQELFNKNEIPEQLMCKLESPYDPPVDERNGHNLEAQIQNHSQRYKEEVDYLYRRISQVTRSEAFLVNEDKPRQLDQPVPGSFYIRLDSARASGEMILRVQDALRIDLQPLDSWKKPAIIWRQNRFYEEALVRIYGVREEDGLALYREAEMLVGGPDVTREYDIEGLFYRFEKPPEPRFDDHNFEDLLPSFTDKKISWYLNSCFQWDGTVTTAKVNGDIRMDFDLGAAGSQHQSVNVERRGDYCHFESVVAAPSVVNQLSPRRLLELTWIRNRHIDLVGFLVRPDGCMVGRTVHPLGSMALQEFAYSAYILAVEAKRMEYLLSKQSDYV